MRQPAGPTAGHAAVDRRRMARARRGPPHASPTRRSRQAVAWPSTRTPGRTSRRRPRSTAWSRRRTRRGSGSVLDVGHYLVGGGDPVRGPRVARRARHPRPPQGRRSGRPGAVVRRATLSGLGEAVDQRIFTELGAGSLDLLGVLRVLAGRGYDGWLMVEQDSSWSPPSEAAAIGRRVLAQALATVGRRPATGRADRARARSDCDVDVIDRRTRRGLVSRWMTQVIWSCTSRRSDDRGRGLRPGPGNGSDRSCGCRRRRRKAHPNIFRRTLSVARTCRA